MARVVSLTGITTITFDADDTLWDFESGMLAALGRLRKEIVTLANKSARIPTLEEMVATRMSLGDEPQNADGTLDALRKEAIRRSAGEAGLTGDRVIEDLFDMYVTTRVTSTTIYPETIPVLETLKQHFQLGVITNSNTNPAEVGLKGQFSFAILADSEPFRKPDPRIFLHAASVGEYDLEKSIHVGDSLVTDVAGANNAGVTSVWLNHHDESDDRGDLADHTINALSELPLLLGIA
ncbi:MAG: HAD family hydrolase [Chloroflexi bacterium]|jgi:FMN hydrolase / 5-amino-6-(5-phospho-D-ribitylamino)uracil phosphatase|nr:HAD family hydrolase [Chloroflexota bacterium]MBT4074433.1 HAD family hydrolase [Chloroflexota bacterium]MBT5318492.1 HAD family hydrolase [Chloroflexota bacterium]MBT6680530.1 HAD family hydrolase [Chloroflexota bacterium]